MTNGQDDDSARGPARFLRSLVPPSRRVRRRIIACGLLVLGPALFVAIPSSGKSESACDALRRWARVYEGSSPTLEEVARFDRAHRVAIFNALTPTVRARLWQEQLHRFTRQPGLTDAQRALITEGLALMTPALYDRDVAARGAFEQFWSRAEASFAAAPDRLGWYELGSVTPGFESAKRVPSFWDTLSNPFRANANFGACTCRNGTEPSCGSGACVSGGCSPTSVGCGPSFQSPCTGLCVY